MFSKLKAFLAKNPSYRFIIIFLVAYLILDYFTLFYMGVTAPGNLYSSFLDENLNYVRGFRLFLLSITSGILQLMGHDVVTTDTMLHAYNVGGFNIVYSCLGFGVMSFFVAFVIAYPKSLKSKLLFIPIGLILIQSLNVLRLLLITLYWKRSFLMGIIDHHTLFNIILYALLLAMLYLWVNSGNKNANELQPMSSAGGGGHRPEVEKKY